MCGKITLILCAEVLLMQSISAQSIGAIDTCGYEVSWGVAPLDTTSWGATYSSTLTSEWAYAPASTLSASNGPGLAISSASPRIPAGVSVISDNAYEGLLVVDGTIPFLGTTILEGALPTAGCGGTVYSCGNGAVGITTEDMGGYGVSNIACPLGYGAGMVYGSGIGYGPSGYSIFQ